MLLGLFFVVSIAILLPYDGVLSDWVRNCESYGCETFDDAFAQLGKFQNFCIGIPLVLFALACWRKNPRLRRTAVGFFMACMISGIVVQIVKPLVGRARPAQCHRENIGPIEIIGPTLKRGYNSYPSGHTASMVAGCTVMALTFPKLLWPCFLACLAMAWARIHGSSHFPIDTLHGAVIGLLCAVACCRRNSNLKWIIRRASLLEPPLLILKNPHLAKAREFVSSFLF
jgi:membrane-associated phospholipid phosphatase